jgi:hypothetical protein
MEKGNYIFLIMKNTMCDNCDKLGDCTLVYFYFFNRCDLRQDIFQMLNLHWHLQMQKFFSKYCLHM